MESFMSDHHTRSSETFIVNPAQNMGILRQGYLQTDSGRYDQNPHHLSIEPPDHCQIGCELFYRAHSMGLLYDRRLSGFMVSLDKYSIRTRHPPAYTGRFTRTGYGARLFLLIIWVTNMLAASRISTINNSTTKLLKLDMKLPLLRTSQDRGLHRPSAPERVFIDKDKVNAAHFMGLQCNREVSRQSYLMTQQSL